jgi:hypothetical protein
MILHSLFILGILITETHGLDPAVPVIFFLFYVLNMFFLSRCCLYEYGKWYLFGESVVVLSRSIGDCAWFY